MDPNANDTFYECNTTLLGVPDWHLCPSHLFCSQLYELFQLQRPRSKYVCLPAAQPGCFEAGTMLEEYIMS